MLETELVELVRLIRARQCEGQTIEVKKASVDCPTSLYDSLSSFSNQNQGGIIVFGLDEKANFDLVGVYDAQDLQHKVTEQCREMEPQVRALFTTAEIDGRVIVSAEIPSQDVTHRPVYYRGKGRLGGSYVRVGDADEQMSEFEIYSYEAYRNHERSDRRIIADADLSLWNTVLLAQYVAAVKTDRPNLSEYVKDSEIPEKMGVVKDGHPSLAGLMVFCPCPQVYLPQLCVTAVVVPGEKIGVVNKDGLRFTDDQKISGTIPEMLERTMAFVARNVKQKMGFDANGNRVDRTEYPLKAIREAVLNALIHRDYSPYTESVPVRVEIYSDRLVVSNKGGLYGAVPIAALGKTNIGKRNAFLVDMLEALNKTENRNSGIATMQAECRAYGIPDPMFCEIHGEFRVVFRNCMPADRVVYDRSRSEETILAYCEIPRSREELAAFTGLNQVYVMASLIRPLLLARKLLRTDPASPKSPFQRFVRA
ncbi:MAG: ATP-binding protein [bacterium]|nr:ATP-binding protein [bacterium]